MPDKWSRYLLIAILVGVVIIIYFVYQNKKDTGDQSNLLLAMADKLGAGDKSENIQPPTSNLQPLTSKREETEEDGAEIVRIAEKIYNQEELTRQEKEFQKIFPDEIDSEVKFSETFYSLVDKFVRGEKDFSQQEQQFYENNKEAIETELNRIKSKENNLETESTATVENPASNIKLEKANPPLTQDERIKTILSIFDDGIPKSVPEIKKLYIQATGKDPGSYMYSTLNKLEKDELLFSKKINKINYFGLPEWFQEGKMISEYKQKIS